MPALGTDDLLVTKCTGELTGVEIRSPDIKLSALARVNKVGGALPATGWNERFDQVNGTLTLPPGHRLLAALGADHAPGAWLEQWSLMDVFLVLLASAVAFRLFGVAYAAVAFVGLALVHQENAIVVWVFLLALVTLILFRQVPEGRFRTLSRWLNYAALAVLLIQIVPFAVEQVRFALYPQLADPGWTDGPRAREPKAPEVAQLALRRADMPPPPPHATEISPSASNLQEEAVENPYGLAALTVSPLDWMSRASSRASSWATRCS